jgi:hypothetical protein
MTEVKRIALAVESFLIASTAGNTLCGVADGEFDKTL